MGLSDRVMRFREEDQTSCEGLVPEGERRRQGLLSPGSPGHICFRSGCSLAWGKPSLPPEPRFTVCGRHRGQRLRCWCSRRQRGHILQALHVTGSPGGAQWKDHLQSGRRRGALGFVTGLEVPEEGAAAISSMIKWTGNSQQDTVHGSQELATALKQLSTHTRCHRIDGAPFYCCLLNKLRLKERMALFKD